MDKSEDMINSGYSDGLRVRKGIYTICFVLLCLIDQLVGSAMGRVQYVAVNCTGFIMAAIIFTGCRWRDFLKIPYAVWTVVSVFAGGYAIHWGRQNYAYTGQWTTGILNVVIYGYLAIRLFIEIFVEMKLPRVNGRCLILWAAAMLGMIVSRNEALWPLWFFVMFGCFYMTEYSEEELDALFSGMLNGIIIGFFILQGFATMYRAFDEIRYTGLYTNCNMNALFYLMVQAAILGKWYQFKRNGAAVIWRVLAGAGSGILLAYCFLTIGRTAIVVMLLNTVVMTGILSLLEERRRLLKAAGRLAAVLAAAVISFPAVFSSVRDIPAALYSAMALAGDSPGKIQGYVPADDDRYVEMDEFLKAALGRYFEILKWEKKDKSGRRDTQDTNPGEKLADLLLPPIKARAAEDISEPLPEELPWGSGLSKEDPVWADGNSGGAVDVRWAIYRSYLRRMNFRGHASIEDGVWLTPDSWVPHAHDFLLQIMFSHGIVTGLLFMAVLVLAFLYCLVRCFGKKMDSWYYIVGVLVLSSFVGFGIFEVDWRLGQLSFTSAFLVLYLLLHKCGWAYGDPEEEVWIDEDGTDAYV